MIKKIWNNLFNKVNWYNLRTVTPISKTFGLDRGLPIDRYYIEKFLEENKKYIHGKTLEIADNYYSKKFSSKVTSYEILFINDSNKKATIVGDLTNINTLPKEEVDCFICTQTLNFIYDINDAVKGIRHLLKMNGVALVTLAGVCQISRYDMERWGDYWRFTTKSAEKLFVDVFGSDKVKVQSYGNLLSAVSLLEGIASHELTKDELDYLDEDYQVIVTVKAKK
jgi:hypothetical protein